ncbi:hypothetical protein ABPG74_020845 [Tetrahymena malaccensis]
MEPSQQSNLLPPPPPIAPPVPILKQEVPKKRLEKLFESSDEDSKDPFAKAQKIGQQYRQEEKQAKIQAITRQSTSNNTKKKIFDDSDSDVENFKSKQTPQAPAQNNPPQRQTTTKAKIFNSDSEDDDKKPKQQAPPPVPAINNPLAASNNSKPQTDLKPAIKNPLGGLGARVSKNKKRGIMDDSSQNSNSEDESSAQAQNSQAAALKQQQDAEKQRLEAEKQKQEAERIQREEEQARIQQEALKRQQEKEEEERRRKQEQEEQLRQLKLKQQEEERILKQKMEEELKKKQEEEEKKKQSATASQPAQPVAGLGRAAQKKKKNKFGSSSENEDSDEEDAGTSNKNPAPPVIQPTSSIITYNQQSADPAPVLNPMEDALKNSEKQSSTSENPLSRNQSLTNRVSQALKDKIEAMGSLDPTKMLKGMTFIPKKPEQVQEENKPANEQQQDSQQPIDKSLLISTQMDRVSIPMKKKKARTVQKFVDTSDQQQLTTSNNYNNNKTSIIIPDDEDEKPLAVQKRNIHIKEKQPIQPPTSNLPNISSMPKKGLDLGNSDDDSGPLMQKKTQPVNRPSNPVSQTQPKTKGVLDLGASDDDNDKPLMTKKPQVPPVQKQNPLPPLPADDTIKPIQPNPPATLTSSQKNDDSAAQNKLLKGLPNILGAPKTENKKPTKLKFGDSDDDDKPLALTEKRQVQSLMPSNTQSNQTKNKDDDDLGIKPIARNSESLQGASGLPNILSNPLSSNSNQAPSRPSGLPNISGNPLGKSNMATNKDKKEQKKKKVMFSDDEEEEQDSKLPMPKLSQRPSAGLSNDTQENVPKQTSLPQRPSKKSLFGDDSDDDQIGSKNAATNAPKPPERPSANLSGKPKGRNLFDDSDDDVKKPDISAPVSNPLSQSSNMNTAPLKPQLPSLSSKPTTSNRNLFNEDSDDETLKNASKNPLGQSKAVSNPLGQSRPSQNPLGGGKQAPPAKPKKSLFDDSD